MSSEILRIVLSPFHSLRWLDILCSVIDYRSAASDLGSRLIIAVKTVDIEDKLAVEQVKRDMLRANA